MTDSAPSNIVTETSPAQPAPMPPVLEGVSFNKLAATVILTLPAVDVDGKLLVELSNVKVFVNQELPVEFPATYTSGSQVQVVVTVPAYSTSYEFMAEVSD